MQARGSGSAGQGDNQERFLADLRALRDAAAIGYDELAARAHYPSSVLKEAEHGPSLPGLPILAAYVRACEADVPEWEERWRRLAYEAPSDPGLPVRPAGASPAAVAGARAGISVAPPDVYDPERIRAALRGQGGSVDHAARGAGHSPAVTPGRAEPDTAHQGPGTQEAPSAWDSRATGWGDRAGQDSRSQTEGAGRSSDSAGWPASPGSGGSVWETGPGREARSGWDTGAKWDTSSGWDTAVGHDTVPANGNHHATQLGSVFDPPVAEAHGAEASTATVEETLPASWLPSTDHAAPPEVDRPWPEELEAEPARWSSDSQIAPSVTSDSEPAWASADTGSAAADLVESKTAWPPPDARYTAPDLPESKTAWPPPDARYTAPDRAESEAAWPPVSISYAASDRADSGPAWPAADAGHAAPDLADSVAAWRSDDGGYGPARDAGSGSALGQGAGAVPAQAATQPVTAPKPVPVEHRRDRFFPLRLIMVMVVAAIVGSILVLLIR